MLFWIHAISCFSAQGTKPDNKADKTSWTEWAAHVFIWWILTLLPWSGKAKGILLTDLIHFLQVKLHRSGFHRLTFKKGKVLMICLRRKHIPIFYISENGVNSSCVLVFKNPTSNFLSKHEMTSCKCILIEYSLRLCVLKARFINVIHPFIDFTSRHSEEAEIVLELQPKIKKVMFFPKKEL